MSVCTVSRYLDGTNQQRIFTSSATTWNTN
jgi:hypothetical protein